FPVEFTVQGPDWQQLAEYSKKMISELDKTGLVTDLDSDYDANMPEYQIVPDRKLAAAHGVSISTVGQTINAMIGGALAGRYPKNGHRYDIRVELDDSTENPIEKMKDLAVRNNREEMLPLSGMVRIDEKASMSEINRLNRERSVTVYANVKTGQSQ